MKSVYMCEYCDKIGDKTTIKEHELVCKYNPKNETCCTCKHAVINGYTQFVVDCDKNAIKGVGCWEQGVPKIV